jgi:UDP-glucose 4-epimerase
MAPRVLVTGGAGFIGAGVVRRLLDEGYAVRTLDNFSTGRRENLTDVLSDIEVVEGDIQSYERAAKAVRGCDVVLHQAALPSVPRSVQDPITSNAVNVVGTVNTLLAARDADVRRVVFASSSSVYGANPKLPKREDDLTLPLSPYAVAKLAGEGYCRSFSEVYGLETVALRYFNVFGPGQDPTSQYAAVIPNFITAALAGTVPRIFGDGEQSRDFTFIDNVVQANLLAMNAPDVAGRTFNIASGAALSLNDVIAILRRLTGRDIEPEYLPRRPGDIKHSLADISAARAGLGYAPQVTFAEGIGIVLEHFAEALERGSIRSATR